jgi:hypothetical protein
MRKYQLALFLVLLLPLQARAEINPQPEESLSRGLQQAKRVAAMENGNDIPSRTHWLTKRVAEHSKTIASHTKTGAKKKQHKKNDEQKSPAEEL